MPKEKKKNGNGNGKTLTLNGKKYAIHPSAEFVPAMSDQEYEDMKADIALHNVREPIVVWRNYILDGIHRARAVNELGLKQRVPTRPFHGKESEINSTIASLNAHRRHLGDKARAILIAWGIAPELKEQAKARQLKGKPAEDGEEEQGEVTKIVAEKAEVGQATARKSVDIVTELSPKEIKKVIHDPKKHYQEAAREARKRRLQAQGKKPPKETKPKVVDKLTPEYIKKRWYAFIKHWESYSHQRKVREWVLEFLS